MFRVSIVKQVGQTSVTVGVVKGKAVAFQSNILHQIVRGTRHIPSFALGSPTGLRLGGFAAAMPRQIREC